MQFTFNNLNEFSIWLKKQSEYAKTSADMQSAKKDQGYYRGKSSAYYGLAKMIDDNMITIVDGTPKQP